MVSRKQKAICLATGGAAAAALIWLRYAKSAAGARAFLSETSVKAGKTLVSIQGTLSTLLKRAEEIDRLVHELAQVGSEQMARAETVINDTLERLEQTADVIQTNLMQSSNEISGFIEDLRTPLARALGAKDSRVA